MHRRTLLSAVPAAIPLTGCVDVVDTPPDDEEPQRDDDRDVEDRNGDVELTSQDTTPVDVDLDLQAEVVQAAITEEAPPKIRVKATNTGGESPPIRGGRYLFRPHASEEEGDREPVLLGFESTPEYDDTGCWRADGVRYFHGDDEEHGLPPGESTEVVKALATRTDFDDCFPQGTYRFEDSFEVDDAEFTWGFELEIHH